MQHLRITAASLIICAWLVATDFDAACAGIVLSNLNWPASQSYPVGTNELTSFPNTMRAVTFQTGTNAKGYRLNSVTLAMAEPLGSGLGDFIVELYGATANGFPTSPLGSFAVSINPVASGQYTYQFTNDSLTLSPASNYGIVARSPTSSGAVAQYYWRTAAGIDPSSAPGWLIHGHFLALEGSATWGSVRAPAPKFQLDATAVPEPAGLCIAGCALVPFMLRARARKKRQGTWPRRSMLMLSIRPWITYHSTGRTRTDAAAGPSRRLRSSACS